MTNTQIIEETIAFVKETLKGAEGGHDWFHIQRVFKNTLLIAKDEKVDVLVVSLGALLHDIADAKFNGGDETVGPRMAKDFLISLGVDKKAIEHVVKIIENISKEDLEHFFQSLLQNLNSCIHLTVKYGENDHHKVEAAIKSLAVALRSASSYDKKQKGIPSTKGSM